LTNRNNIIKNANEELIFEIVNAQDNEEHIENYARENLNLSMPDEEFIKFNNTDLENQND
jgi:cell division protein FtsB